jgi:hypothetical protein
VDPEPPLLEWFRVDRSRGTTWLLVVGTSLVFAGAALVACGIFTHRTSDTLRNLTLLGAALLIFGLVLAFGGLTVLLSRDEYLGVRADGILIKQSRGDTFLGWETLTGVRCDVGAKAVVFEGTGDPFVLREEYAGAKHAVLAAHLDDLRRKATLAPLDPAYVATVACGMPHRRPD